MRCPSTNSTTPWHASRIASDQSEYPTTVRLHTQKESWNISSHSRPRLCQVPIRYPLRNPIHSSASNPSLPFSLQSPRNATLNYLTSSQLRPILELLFSLPLLLLLPNPPLNQPPLPHLNTCPRRPSINIPHKIIQTEP